MFNKEEVKNKEQKIEQQSSAIKYVVMPQEFRKAERKKLLSRKTIIIGSAGLGALILSVAGVFVYMQITSPAAPPLAANTAPPAKEAPPSPEPETPTTTPEETPSSLLTPPAAIEPETPAVPVIPPVSNLQAGADNDADGLSDREEVIYQTDPTKPDTDGDGF